MFQLKTRGLPRQAKGPTGDEQIENDGLSIRKARSVLGHRSEGPPGSLSHVNSGNVSLLQQAAVWYFKNFRKDSGNIGSQAEAAVS